MTEKVKWYEKSFGEEYLKLYAHRTSSEAAKEVNALLCKLGLSPKTKCLDICCGTGRHLKAMLRAGLDAWGFDLSETLLSQAKQDALLKDRVFQGDIRNIPFDSQFALGLNLFTSFGYFDDDKENETAMNEMFRVLTPKGQLIIDHIYAPHLRDTIIAEDEQTLGETHIHQQRRIVKNRVQKTITITPRNENSYTLTEDVRLYDIDEFTALIENAGGRVLSVHSDYALSEEVGKSGRMIWRVEKI